MLIDESDQGFLNDGQFFGSMIEESIKGISLTSHANIFILTSDLFVEFLWCQFSTSFLNDYDNDRHIFWQANWSTEMSDKGDQQMQNCNDIFWVNTFDTPLGKVVVVAQGLELFGFFS